MKTLIKVVLTVLILAFVIGVSLAFHVALSDKAASMLLSVGAGVAGGQLLSLIWL